MLAEICFTLSAFGQSIGAFVADFNETHIYNPNWPPHARFHNGQTMSMGVCLGLSTLYYTFRPTANKSARKDSLFTAAVMGSLYWMAGLSALFYPGSAAVDPEFVERIGRAPQIPAFAVLAVLPWMGWWWEKREKSGLAGGMKDD